MRTVSQAALDILANPYGLEPVNLVKIYWTPTNIIWYADKNVTADIRGKILELSEFDDTVNFDGSKATQAFNIVLDDVDQSIKNIYNYNDIHKVKIEVYQWFTTIPLDDAFLIFEGEINSPITWKEGERTLAFSVVSQIEDQEVGFSPEEGLFDIIPADMVGKSFPLVFGTCQLVPAQRLDPVPTGILLDSITAPDPSILAQVHELYKKSADLWLQAWAHLLAAAQALENSARVTGSYVNGDEYWEGIAEQENNRAVQIQIQRNKVLQDAFNLLQKRAFQLSGQRNLARVHFGSCFPQNREVDIQLEGGVTARGSMRGTEFQFSGITHPGGAEGSYSSPLPGVSSSSYQSSGTVQVVQKLGQAWSPAGQPFKFTDNVSVRYLACMLSCSVLNVWAFRNYNDTRFLTQVPTEYYSVNTVNYGSMPTTQIVFQKPLSYYDDKWDDEIYVDLTSPVGPNTVSILTWLIENYTSKGIDVASFSLVSAYLSNAPSNFCLLQQTNIIQLLSDIAYQSRCALTLKNDVFYLLFLPAEPAAVDTITEDDILVNTLELGHTATENIITKMIANYTITYSGSSAFKIIIRNNTLKYGIHEQSTDWFIYTAPALVDIAASFWTIRKSNTWKLLRFKTPLSKIRLETFDPVAINLASNWSHNGTVTGIVQSVKLNTKELNLEFEVWLPVRLGEMDKYTFAWPPNSTVRVDSGQSEFPKIGSDASGDLEPDNGATDCRPDQAARISRKSSRSKAGHPTVEEPSPSETAVALAGTPDALDTSEQPEDDYEYNQYQTLEFEDPDSPDSGAFPGLVVDPPDDEGFYSVNTYFRGLDGTPQLTAVRDPSGGPQIAPGTWVTVMLSVWTIFEDGQNHTYSERYMLPSSSRNTFMGKIVGHDSGNSYFVELYPNGISGDPSETVTVKQAQIDPDEVIPSETWTVVLLGSVDNGDGTTTPEYTMQVPVYLGAPPE